jgi:hypothetical protein
MSSLISRLLFGCVCLAVAAPALASCSHTADKPLPDAVSRDAGAGATRARSAAVRVARLNEVSNTRDMLSALADDCLSCAEQNGCLDATQGSGVCETVAAKKDAGATETSLCIDTLRCVFASKCGNPGHQNDCICGKTDVTDCMSGASPPTGTCVAVYKKDFGDDGKFIYHEFVNQTFGAGRANAIAQCVTQLCPTCRIP